jgi:hypothetical protein
VGYQSKGFGKWILLKLINGLRYGKTFFGSDEDFTLFPSFVCDLLQTWVHVHGLPKVSLWPAMPYNLPHEVLITPNNIAYHKGISSL